MPPGIAPFEDCLIPGVTTVLLAGGPATTIGGLGLLSHPAGALGAGTWLSPVTLRSLLLWSNLDPSSSSLAENAPRLSSPGDGMPSGRCGLLEVAWESSASPFRPMKGPNMPLAREPSHFLRGLIGGSGGAFTPVLLFDRSREPDALRDRESPTLSGEDAE